MATRSNISSVINSLTDSSSDSDESYDENDSSDGLEVVEEMSTGKARSTHSEENNTNSNITVRSLLTVLKAPKQSDLTRKRKVAVNPPTGKRKCKSAKGLASVKPLQRTTEFPNESLVVSNGKLFCNSCREEIGLKKSVIKNHVSSTKHVNGKLKMQAKDKRERDIAEALRDYNSQCHLVGETLPIEQQTYRVKVVQTFLRAAVPLNKLQYFRDILEENSFRLTDRRHMSDLVPFVQKEEESLIKREIDGKDVSVIFDGTTRLGEALAIVVRFITNDWTIEHRLVKMQLLAKSLTGKEIARELIHALATEYSVGSNNLLAVMRDRASTNEVAMRTISVLYPSLVDVGCFSHTIDLVGEHFHTATLDEFGMLWISFFAHSPKVKMLWKEQTGLSMPSYSPTRWWSRWEVYKQLMWQFGDLDAFIKRNDDASPVTRGKLLAFFSNGTKKSTLQIELAAIVDFGEPFVKATYRLEGNGPLALDCFEIVDSLSTSIRLCNVPNVEAIAKRLANGSPTAKQKWIDHAKTCIEPGHNYFKRQLTSSLKVPLQAFKAARLLSPSRLHTMKPDIGDVETLAAFPFLKGSIADLKQEFYLYVAKAADVNVDSHDEILKWWKQNTTNLPKWSSAAQKVLLVQPSSAASERVFSLLKASFKDQQDLALQDYIQASLMLQYNRH